MIETLGNGSTEHSSPWDSRKDEAPHGQVREWGLKVGKWLVFWTTVGKQVFMSPETNSAYMTLALLSLCGTVYRDLEKDNSVINRKYIG